ncbi:MAG TPA: hypothetical protein PK890_09465, partial [Terrimesophilobacter sp.]|nr:hypothetical protein [Terrimesophilobacter sp.]
MSTELERERDYVTMLYRRLDELQSEAHEQLAQIRILNVGDHDQSRSERDSQPTERTSVTASSVPPSPWNASY